MTHDEYYEEKHNEEKLRKEYYDRIIVFYKTCPKCGQIDNFEETDHNHGRLVYRTCQEENCKHTWEMKYNETY